METTILESKSLTTLAARNLDSLATPDPFNAEVPDLLDTKIPVGNMPAGFRQFDALTIRQLNLILRAIILDKLNNFNP